MANWLLGVVVPLIGLAGLGVLLAPWTTQERLEPAAHLLSVDNDDVDA